MPISTVLFDYSGVLTNLLDLPVIGVQFETGLLREEMTKALAGSEPHPWHEVERGERPLAAFLDWLEVRVPGSSVIFDPESPINTMGGMRLLEDRLRIVADLKAADYRVGLVTNNVAEWQSLWRPRLPGGLFEVVIDSAYVGCRKPEPEIYQLAMNMLGIDDPSEVLFVDDFEWNVAGAEAMGMVGLHVTPDTDFRSALAEHVGEVGRRSRLPAGRRRRRN